MTRPSLWLTPLVVIASGCLSFNYVRFSHGEPIADALIAGVVPGLTRMDECLARFGAPDIIWSSETGDVKMAYAWLDAADWGFSLSYSFERFVSTRVRFDASNEDIEGVVLLFDPDLTLRTVKRGYLRDLVADPEEADPTGHMLSNTPR